MNNDNHRSIDFYYLINNKETYIQVEFTLNDDCYEREIGNLLFAPSNAKRINIFNSNVSTKRIPPDVINISVDEFLMQEHKLLKNI